LHPPAVEGLRKGREYLKKLVDSETAKMGAAIRAAGIQQF
jgi:hypothetical protein